MKLFDPVPGRKNSMAPGKARTTRMVPTMLLKRRQARDDRGRAGRQRHHQRDTRNQIKSQPLPLNASSEIC